MTQTTIEQQSVVNAKVTLGYEFIGYTKSLVNGLDCSVLSKGKHLVVVNTLGYDEHYQGKTWRIYE